MSPGAIHQVSSNSSQRCLKVWVSARSDIIREARHRPRPPPSSPAIKDEGVLPHSIMGSITKLSPRHSEVKSLGPEPADNESCRSRRTALFSEYHWVTGCLTAVINGSSAALNTDRRFLQPDAKYHGRLLETRVAGELLTRGN